MPIEDTFEQEVHELIVNEPGLSASQIQATTKRAKSSVYYVVGRLLDAGKIRKDGASLYHVGSPESVSGEILDPPASSIDGRPDLTDAEPDEVRERAQEVETKIEQGVGAIRTAGVHVAGYLDEFIESRMWEVLGYDTIQEWLAQPGIELKPSHARTLRRVYRELVIVRQVPIAELEGVSMEKVATGLKAISDGNSTWKDVVEDAKALGLRDMRDKYRGDPNAPLDAQTEPERAECPTCGSWVTSDRLKEGEGEAR